MVDAESPSNMDVEESRALPQTELEELKVCDIVLKRVKDIETLLVAEVAKHWRTSEAKRENFEKVARQVTQAAMVGVLDLKQKCVAQRESRQCFEQVMTSLGCATQVEFVTKMEELVECATIVNAIEEATSWSQETIVEKCTDLSKVIAQKEVELSQLQAKLVEQQREIERLRRAGTAEAREVKLDIPEWARQAAAREQLDGSSVEELLAEDTQSARCNERGHRAKECKYTNREEFGSRAVGVEDQPQRLTKRGCQEKSREDKSTNKPGVGETVKESTETGRDVWFGTIPKGQTPNAVKVEAPVVENKTVVVHSKRKRGRRKRMSVLHSRTITLDNDVSSRIEDDFDVVDPMHFLHVKFACDGQAFPSVNGRPGFPLTQCRCSQNIVVGDLLPMVPQPAYDERVECVLDAARALAVWWGPGSISLKVQRIVDKSYMALTPKAVAFAYAFFRAKCMHVSIMTAMVPLTARLRHNSLSGWPWDTTNIIEYGWNLGRRLEWPEVAPAVQKASEHSRVVVVVPEVLHRLKHCHHGPKTEIFYYQSFKQIRTTNNVIFSDEVGNVVLVLPPREPEDRYSWIQFVGALDLWLRCGAHVWVVNGPRSIEDNSWNRMNQKAREHMVGYLDANPDFLPQLHDLVPAEAGVLKASMACLKVGVVKDPRKRWDAPQALEFYGYLRTQLADTLHLEEMKMPKSMRPTGQPSGRAISNVSGVPAIRDGRISKRHLKRVEKRKQRSLQRAAERELSGMTL
ncbi:hypothetical protein Aduo_018780 [Ancylostoma duodenale]